MTQSLSARAIFPLRLLLLSALLAGLVYYIAISIHWPIVWDAAVMHYVTFLLGHGLEPYRDITDSNMPGSYLAEIIGMHVFGAGDMAWRIYDLFLCGMVTLASVEIARPVDWLAGLYAGIFFTLMHGSDGPRFTGERDLVVAALLICGLALLFRALRKSRPPWMLLFGLAGAGAASIKPTSAPLPIILLIAAAVLLRRKRQPATAYILWALGGASVGAAAVVGFLLAHHAFRDFFFVTTHLLSSYVSLNHIGVVEMIRLLLPNSVSLTVALIVFLALWNRGWDDERWLVLLCAAFGAFSYFSQLKGFPYHRYPLFAFLFLLMGMELLAGLRRPGISRLVAAAAIAITVLMSVPHILRPLRAESHTFPVNFSEGLSADLDRLGTDRLQGNVQCFDLTYGCFSALYRLRVMQSNGFTGDLLLFSPGRNEAVDYYRKTFSQLQARRPVPVLVITNEWFQESNSFSKLKAWPEFDMDLRSNYTLITARHFPVTDGPPPKGDPPEPGYRIYIRNDSPLLASAQRS